VVHRPVCPRCEHVNRHAARFCAVCGMRLRRSVRRRCCPPSDGDGWLILLVLLALLAVFVIVGSVRTARSHRPAPHHGFRELQMQVEMENDGHEQTMPAPHPHDGDCWTEVVE
jgi:hypothetical protein